MFRAPTRHQLRRSAIVASLALVTGLLSALSAVTPAQASASYTAYPIPTSSSEPGRIVTATNGNMWFVETQIASSAAKVGRITPSGHIDEFTVSTANYNDGVDIDASPDGTIWVLLNQKAVQLSASGQVLQTVNLPDYSTALRVDRNGRPWVVWTDPYGHLGYISGGTFHTPLNAPDCDDLNGDELGIGSDNVAWCAASYGGESVTRSNASGTASQTFPLGNDAFGPLSLAAGPIGSVWFSHYFSHYLFPGDRGRVGYVTAAGQVGRYNTGSRTAPSQIVRRPGTTQMWFADVGATPAIGHIDTSGHGSIHTVGSYAPTALTFDHSGQIWFTDTEHNTIVRVNPNALMTTNIDRGSGSVLDPPPSLRTGTIKKHRRAVHVKHHKRFKLKHTCPTRLTSQCRAKITVKTRHKVGHKHPAVAKVKHLRYQAGSHHTIKFKLTKKGRKLLRHHKKLKVTVRLYLPHHKKPSSKRSITLHR